MPAQPLYKDLSKRTNDLLTKDYPSEAKVEYTGKTADGNLDANVTFKKDGKVAAVFTPKWKFVVNQQPVQTLLEVTSKKDLKLEVTVEPTAVKNLKTVLTATVKDEADLVETVNVEYKHETVTANFNLDVKPKGYAAKLTAVAGLKDFSFGALAEYFFDNKGDLTPQEHSLTATYRPNSQTDVSLVGRVNYRGAEVKNEVGASYFQSVNNKVSVGAEVLFDADNFEAKPKVGLAALFKPDSSVSVKAKADGNGKVTVAVQQVLTPRAKLTLSTSTDTHGFKDYNGNGLSNVGLLLSLND